MELSLFAPKSQLVVKQTLLTAPRFPVVDAHNHLAEPFGGGWDQRSLSELLDVLDQAGVSHFVDLDGGWGEDILCRHLDKFKTAAPERFSVFGGVDWAQWERLGEAFPEWAAERLAVQKARGASGVKIWKGFGLQVRDHLGQLARIDDPRLDPIWQACAELDLPVVIHIADPAAFFEPLDARNERWEELSQHPEWAFPSPPYPAFSELLNELANLVQRHPRTVFIGAHVGCYAENLAWVAGLMERCPNFNVDISARLGELGRQPYTARQFFANYADRILFGLDLGPHLPSYRISYRLLETDDEYFNYNDSEVPLQGRWYAYGLYLEEDILEKVYRKNAERLILKKS